MIGVIDCTGVVAVSPGEVSSSRDMEVDGCDALDDIEVTVIFGGGVFLDVVDPGTGNGNSLL